MSPIERKDCEDQGAKPITSGKWISTVTQVGFTVFFAFVHVYGFLLWNAMFLVSIVDSGKCDFSPLKREYGHIGVLIVVCLTSMRLWVVVSCMCMCVCCENI